MEDKNRQQGNQGNQTNKPDYQKKPEEGQTTRTVPGTEGNKANDEGRDTGRDGNAATHESYKGSAE